MKKVILLFVLFSISTTAILAEVILAPQWSEFCPVSYMNAKASRLSTDSNYWYHRRMQFEEALSQCNPYQGEDLKSCYAQIRSAENNKNKYWKAKQAARKEAHQEYLEYQRKQQTINAVQDIVRTFSK